jgi:hypothetical protein
MAPTLPFLTSSDRTEKNLIVDDDVEINHQDYSSTIVLISSSEDESSVGDGDGNNRGNNATDGAPSDGEEIISPDEGTSSVATDKKT